MVFSRCGNRNLDSVTEVKAKIHRLDKKCTDNGVKQG